MILYLVAGCAEITYDVPKDYFWPDRPEIVVCDSADETLTQLGLSRIDMDYRRVLVTDEHCGCKDDVRPDNGVIEVLSVPLEDDISGRTRRYSRGEEMISACVYIQEGAVYQSPVAVDVYAHELGHGCGFDHALDAETGEKAGGHVMSWSTTITGYRTDDMDTPCTELD